MDAWLWQPPQGLASHNPPNDEACAGDKGRGRKTGLWSSGGAVLSR